LSSDENENYRAIAHRREVDNRGAGETVISTALRIILDWADLKRVET
jgi:hypothetical protein